MATYALSGSGLQALTAGTTVLFVTVTAAPLTASHGRADPPNLYDIGLLRFVQSGFCLPVVPIDATHMWLPVPSGTDTLGYALFGGSTVSVSESTPPAGTPFVSDTFTAATGTALVSHTPDIGSAWVNEQDAVYITSNRLQPLAAMTAFTHNPTTPPSGDYQVEADFTVLINGDASSMSLVARLTPGVSGYGLQFVLNTHTWNILQNLSTVLASHVDTSFTSGTKHAVFKLLGTTLSAIVDGTTIMSITDTNYSSGIVGFTMDSGSANSLAIDNFKAT